MDQLSEFERRAITAIAVGDRQKEVILAQLSIATCSSRDYTGVGLFTELVVDGPTEKLDESRSHADEDSNIDATHPDVPDGIGLILWLKDGYIHCLESYTYAGNWPQDESLIQIAT